MIINSFLRKSIISQHGPMLISQKKELNKGIILQPDIEVNIVIFFPNLH